MLSGRFTQLKAQHIYRAYNKDADLLSKEVLLLVKDGMYFAVRNEGHYENYERLEVR